MVVNFQFKFSQYSTNRRMTRKRIELQRDPKKSTVDNPDTFSRFLSYSTVQSIEKKKLQK